MPKLNGNPQLEHGHTRIANELLEALLRYPFRGGELKVVLAIIRFTYGWHLKARPIKQRDLARLTGFQLRHIKRLLTSLRRQGILFRQRYSRPFTYQLNKAYYGWREWPSSGQGGKAVTFEPQDSGGTVKGSTLSPQGAQDVTFAGDRPVTPYKEKKERVLKERACHPAVENLLSQFSDLLKRPLTEEEQIVVDRLYAVSPAQTQLLLVHARQQTGGFDKALRARNGSSGSVEAAV